MFTKLLKNGFQEFSPYARRQQWYIAIRVQYTNRMQPAPIPGFGVVCFVRASEDRDLKVRRNLVVTAMPGHHTFCSRLEIYATESNLTKKRYTAPR